MFYYRKKSLSMNWLAESCSVSCRNGMACHSRFMPWLKPACYRRRRNASSNFCENVCAKTDSSSMWNHDSDQCGLVSMSRRIWFRCFQQSAWFKRIIILNSFLSGACMWLLEIGTSWHEICHNHFDQLIHRSEKEIAMSRSIDFYADDYKVTIDTNWIEAEKYRLIQSLSVFGFDKRWNTKCS